MLGVVFGRVGAHDAIDDFLDLDLDDALDVLGFHGHLLHLLHYLPTQINRLLIYSTGYRYSTSGHGYNDLQRSISVTCWS